MPNTITLYLRLTPAEVAALDALVVAERRASRANMLAALVVEAMRARGERAG
jgi:hypothetical protein